MNNENLLSAWEIGARFFRRFLLYALMLIMVMPAVSSCGKPSNDKIIKKMERQSRRNPPPEDLAAIARNRGASRKVRKAIKKHEKRQERALKAAIKEQNAAIKRHQDMQSPETRERMERNVRETNRSIKPESFWSRTFRRKTEQEKMERQRKKEARERF